MSLLHHLALGTRDVERLASFYRDVLGLREVRRTQHADGALRSVWFDLGGPVLMIEPTDEAPRSVTGVAAGLFLLALTVSEAQRPAFEARLHDAGFGVEERSEWTCYARDPDGNRIALSAYPLPALALG